MGLFGLSSHRLWDARPPTPPPQQTHTPQPQTPPTKNHSATSSPAAPPPGWPPPSGRPLAGSSSRWRRARASGPASSRTGVGGVVVLGVWVVDWSIHALVRSLCRVYGLMGLNPPYIPSIYTRNVNPYATHTTAFLSAMLTAITLLTIKTAEGYWGSVRDSTKVIFVIWVLLLLKVVCRWGVFYGLGDRLIDADALYHQIVTKTPKTDVLLRQVRLLGYVSLQPTHPQKSHPNTNTTNPPTTLNTIHPHKQASTTRCGRSPSSSSSAASGG